MLNQNNQSDIFIDRDGVWYFRGMEMKRHDIVRYFYRHLKRDGDGKYLIEIEDDRCYVRIEDAPFVIKSVSIGGPINAERPYLELFLSDGSTEGLNLSAPLWIGEDNVLYCWVKRGEFEARFSRPAYYQFCEYIEYDSRRDKYILILNQKSNSLVLTKNTSDKTRLTGGELDKPKVIGGSDVR